MIKKVNKIIAIILTIIMIITLFRILYTNNVQADSYRYTYDGNNLDTGVYPRI